MPRGKMKLVPITVMLSQEQADRLTRESREQMISVSQIVRGIITRALGATSPQKHQRTTLEKGIIA